MIRCLPLAISDNTETELGGLVSPDPLLPGARGLQRDSFTF